VSDQQDNKAKKPRLNLTTSQVAASALAACCASIVASYLGVAGTVIGAAVGSVAATTGAAIYGHLFRTSGDKIKQTLLVNGQEVEVEVDRDDAVTEVAVPAGRFYGAQSNTTTADLWHPKTPTGETQVITEDSEEADETKADASPISSRIVRIKKYRKPMGIAAAIIAVFCISIVVGVIAGAPVRSAGSSSSPATVTTTTTVTDTKHTQGQSSNGSSSSSASPSSGGTSSATAPSSGSATSSSSAGSTTSPTASPSSTGPTSTGQALSGATSTGSPTS
jgi:hypothetical protein